ncbi:unnamed protein product [Rotaria sp. Silwood2]|nr:unnamed protein product [Rotaria sp. Silwood2]
MATTTTDKSLCDVCRKVKETSKCEGCSKIFCYNHFDDHRQELNQQLDEVEVTRNLLRQALKRDLIDKIRQTADEARQLLLQNTAKHITDIEIQLNKLTDQLRQSHQNNDFVETDLHRWKKQFIQLTDELGKPPNITIQQGSESLVKKNSVDISTRDTCGTLVAGGHGQGNRLNQLNGPGYIFVDQDYSVYISDENNHRVMKWTKDATEGIVVAGGHGPGSGPFQLSGPRGVIVDQLGTIFVADYLNN